jgi:ABC-type branched-chain amino acid transport systems, ATPase component
LLSIKGVTKNFGGLTAVQDVTFDVPEHGVVGLIGPNGSGKTTLFNLISGVFPLSAGEVVFDGKNISNLTSSKIADYGLVRTFQISKPFNNISALENVMVGAFQRHPARSKAIEKSMEIMELLEILSHRDALPKNLPLAIKKRLEIARILSTEPKMILLDEVMGGLNPQETDNLVQIIRKIHQSGLTILIIEHKMKCIMELSQNVVILNNGKMIAHDTPEKVVKNPDVIKAYLGEDYDVSSY